MLFLGHYMDCIQRRSETYATFTNGRLTTTCRRALLCIVLFDQRRKMAKMKRVAFDYHIELPEFFNCQWAKHLGCQIYFSRIRFNYRRHFSVVAGSDRTIFCHNENAGQGHPWLVAGIWWCMYHFL